MSDGAAPAKPGDPALLRKNHGRSHSYWIDGEKVPGVTTIINAGYPKGALIGWAAGATADYAVDHWDELAERTPSQRLKALQRARFDVQREASLRGTRIHDLARRHLGGEEVEVPEDLELHFDSYERFLDEWAVRDLIVERPFFAPARRYAGTPDLVAELRDGKTWLIDWKSGAKGVYLEHVLQLAALRYADVYLDDAGAVRPVPKVDGAALIHLRADGYDLYPVEAGEQAFRTFLYVREVGRFVESEKDEWIGDALRPPVAVT